ncbi:MAG TPA: PHP domain-containing protein [Desulfotomaculum sp.]|nr:MAG: histidinol phosphatase [Desulfotomaculum sp. BICA1-6]HBX24073.1 PHP domain-containing protein [Desulfotomaculum sp.]
MLLPDYHIHTARCGHAAGRMEEYIEHALALGLKEIGFADHIPMYWLQEGDRDPELAMPECDLGDYVAEVERLRKLYPDITIRLGIEVDYIPGHENQARSILERYPFDYVLGSVHYLDGWGFDNPAYIHRYETYDLDELYRRYFKRVQQAAQSRLFDIIAHPDLVKKFGFKPTCDLQGLYDETARAFAEAGVCAEVNTAGLRVPASEIYPAEGFLRACRNNGVPVTVGSDAHLPNQVGQGFDRAMELLTRVGYEKTVSFSQRKII